MAPEDQFFRNQMFQQMLDRFDAQERKLDNLGEQISDLKANMKYIYGFAAAVGIIGSYLISFIKAKLTQ